MVLFVFDQRTRSNWIRFRPIDANLKHSLTGIFLLTSLELNACSVLQAIDGLPLSLNMTTLPLRVGSVISTVVTKKTIPGLLIKIHFVGIRGRHVPVIPVNTTVSMIWWLPVHQLATRLVVMLTILLSHILRAILRQP